MYCRFQAAALFTKQRGKECSSLSSGKRVKLKSFFSNGYRRGKKGIHLLAAEKGLCSHVVASKRGGLLASRKRVVLIFD